MESSVKIDPKKYAPVLWDVDISSVSLDEDFIVRRVLKNGGFFMIKDLILTLGRKRVKEIFDLMKPTEFQEKRYVYFKEFLFA